MTSQLKNRLSRVIKIWKGVHYNLCDSVSGSLGTSLENHLGPFHSCAVNRRRKACSGFLQILLSRAKNQNCRTKNPRTHLLIHLWCCRNSWKSQEGTDPVVSKGASKGRRESGRHSAWAVWHPLLCPLCPLCPFWTADLDCYFFQLLLQVIPSLFLLLIFFKVGLRAL